MPTFHEPVELKADADVSWGAVGDLAAVDRWVPGMASAAMDGPSRMCHVADGRVQHEQIIDYSPERRSVRCSIEDGLPIGDNRGRLAVGAGPGGSRIVWDSIFEPLDPAAEPQGTEMWRASVPMVLVDRELLCKTAAA